MKVVFGELNELLSELKEKEIYDVRIEALYDERYSKQGIPFLKVYVTAQALLPQHFYGPHERVTANLVGYYERVTFKGIKPFTKEELKSIFDNNLNAKEEVEDHLRDAGFIVRTGFFKEE